MPEDWQPDENLREWFRQHPIATFVNPVLETEKFRNYWHAKTRDNTKLDWPATWRNWMLSSAQRSGYGGQTHADLEQHSARVVGLFD